MNQRLQSMVDLAIILGTIDADREELINEAHENMLKAKSKQHRIDWLNKMKSLKEERSDVVKEDLDQKLQDRIK